jgi:1,4-alpha-glucan branching enzyme
VGNHGGRTTEDIERDGFGQSLRVTLPPLTTIVFKWSGKA